MSESVNLRENKGKNCDANSMVLRVVPRPSSASVVSHFAFVLRANNMRAGKGRESEVKETKGIQM